MAKIEKREALENLEDIVDAADGVMVARGDLGVETPLAEVPIAQKRIIAVANERGRPVVTATQMLESMVENPSPTRAEIGGVANAVLDGTDAVMLSAETAIGRFPLRAAETLVASSRRRSADIPTVARSSASAGVATDRSGRRSRLRPAGCPLISLPSWSRRPRASARSPS